jgi:hypothetical protein
MGRLCSLPDKEEVPGSNPGAPTSHLQGFLPLAPPPAPPSATILQPKCSVADGTLWDSPGLAVTDVNHVKVWQTVGKLRRRRGLVMSGEPREPGYRVEDWR